MTKLPMLIPRAEILTIAAAARYARRSETQVRRWCADYGISRQVTGNSPHEVSRLALDMVLHADWIALDLLKTGNRAAPEVQRYIDLMAAEG